jgi:hypothetical protein
MNIVFPPSYFKYLSQTNCPFFGEIWARELGNLANDIQWIDTLEKEDGTTYSRNPDSDDFPTYYNWPESWRRAYSRSVSEAEAKKKQHLRDAETHKLDEITLFILDDLEEVWLSTPHFNNGTIEKMDGLDPYDSVSTAAYVFLNLFNEWKAKHKNTWKAANILSSGNALPERDSVICEVCGHTFKSRHYDDFDICSECKPV